MTLDDGWLNGLPVAEPERKKKHGRGKNRLGPPDRLISIEEARERALTRYFTGEPCIRGHIAERLLANGGCMDCVRKKPGNPNLAPTVRAGKGPILTPGRSWPPPPIKDDDERPITDRLALSAKEQKQILETYAATRNYELAARAVGLTPPLLDVRIGFNANFHQAVAALERRLELKRPVNTAPATPVGAYEWDSDKRALFLERYVDTGDIAAARESIGVTPSEFNRETERNPTFAEAVAKAEPQAMKALEERAVQMALAGNDKLLVQVLKAKNPEYRDRLSMEVKTEVRLNDDQLDARIRQLSRGRIIDIAVEQEGEARASHLIGREGAAGVAEQVQESVSDDWLATS